MPLIDNPNLTLTTVGDNVTINVRYEVEINPVEQFLAGHGLRFIERIAVIGVDPPGGTTGTVLHNFPFDIIDVQPLGGTTGTVLHNFPPEPLPATLGGGNQIIGRNRSLTVTRASLQEDAGLGDADEIRCRITIELLNLPANVTRFTDQEILLG